jgi:hypothetical protein
MPSGRRKAARASRSEHHLEERTHVVLTIGFARVLLLALRLVAGAVQEQRGSPKCQRRLRQLPLVI